MGLKLELFLLAKSTSTATTVIGALDSVAVVVKTMSFDIFSVFCVAVISAKAIAGQHLRYYL